MSTLSAQTVSLVVGVILDLRRDHSDMSFDPIGPIFHRWLPNGRSDSIALTNAPRAEAVTVWFERRSKNVDGWLHYDWEGKDFDESVMKRQTPVDAGYLCAECVFPACSLDLFKSLEACNRDGPHKECASPLLVERFGKLVHTSIFPPIGLFVNRLRVQFGQYWLSPIRTWDSRSETLGHYFKSAHAYWKPVAGSKNNPFVPTSSSMMLTIVAHDDSPNLLTEDDWRYLAATSIAPVNPTPGECVLADAHRFACDGDLLRALIDAVTAMELLVQEALTRPYVAKSDAHKRAVEFCKTSEGGLAARVVAIAAMNPKIDKELVEPCLKAIKRRHDAVHMGHRPEVHTEVANEVRAVLQLGRCLVSFDRFKLPRASRGSQLGP